MQSKLGPHSEVWTEGLNRAIAWLKEQPSGPKIIIEQNRNLGDTLHLIPVIRHYRNVHPDAKIVFLTALPYAGAHEYNQDIDKIFTIQSLGPQHRIALRKKLMNSGIKFIAPSIFPYGEVWPGLVWSHPNIADQYLHNSDIKDLTPNGGRRLFVNITEDDEQWAKRFLEQHNPNNKKLCSLEYVSYSHTPVWKPDKFKTFIDRIRTYDVFCVCFAGPKERAIAGSIDATGVSWRRTVALMEKIDVHVGIGSGITMLAAAVKNQPKICEVGVPETITMKGCGYAPSIRIVNLDPTIVADHVWFKVLH